MGLEAQDDTAGHVCRSSRLCGEGTPLDKPDIWCLSTCSPMSDQLQHAYYGRFARIAAYRTKVWQVLTHEYFSRWIKPTDTVLDLGCGWGEFINQIRAEKKYGMDLNPDSPS